MDKPNAPIFATGARDLNGIHGESEHTARAYPGSFFEERASISTDYIHSMHTETEHGVRHAGGRSTIER